MILFLLGVSITINILLIVGVIIYFKVKKLMNKSFSLDDLTKDEIKDFYGTDVF